MIKTIKQYPFVTLKSNSRDEMYSKRAHSHKEVSLGYIESGHTNIMVDNQKYRLIPGDIVLIPTETVHLCVPEEVKGYKFQMIYFDTPWWIDHLDIIPDSFKTLAVPADDSLKKLINDIVLGTLDPNTLEQKIIASITDLADKFELNGKGIESSELEIQKIHRQIKEMPQISITVEQMAEKAGLNKFSFIRKYAQRYGLTPHADVVNMRIQRAILLFESDLDLVNVALDCGFADQSHFINQFKLYTGLRPQEYRSSLSL